MPKRFRVRRVRSGRRFVFETDSQADYLRFLVSELAGDFGVSCDVSVTDSSDDDSGWLRVELTRSETAEPNRPSALRFIEFGDELQHIFSTFYDCDGQERRANRRAWKVRHRKDQPWI